MGGGGSVRCMYFKNAIKFRHFRIREYSVFLIKVIYFMLDFTSIIILCSFLSALITILTLLDY